MTAKYTRMTSIADGLIHDWRPSTKGQAHLVAECGARIGDCYQRRPVREGDDECVTCFPIGVPEMETSDPIDAVRADLAAAVEIESMTRTAGALNAAVSPDHVVQLARQCRWVDEGTRGHVVIDAFGELAVMVRLDGEDAPMKYQGLEVDTRFLAAALDDWPELVLRVG